MISRDQTFWRLVPEGRPESEISRDQTFWATCSRGPLRKAELATPGYFIMIKNETTTTASTADEQHKSLNSGAVFFLTSTADEQRKLLNSGVQTFLVSNLRPELVAEIQIKFQNWAWIPRLRKMIKKTRFLKQQRKNGLHIRAI